MESEEGEDDIVLPIDSVSNANGDSSLSEVSASINGHDSPVCKYFRKSKIEKVCLQCKKVFSVSSSTTTLKNHLKSFHIKAYND